MERPALSWHGAAVNRRHRLFGSGAQQAIRKRACLPEETHTGKGTGQTPAVTRRHDSPARARASFCVRKVASCRAGRVHCAGGDFYDRYIGRAYTHRLSTECGHACPSDEGNGPPARADRQRKTELIVQDAQTYAALLERVKRTETLAALRQSIAEHERGAGQPAQTTFDELRHTKQSSRFGAWHAQWLQDLSPAPTLRDEDLSRTALYARDDDHTFSLQQDTEAPVR